MLDSINHIKITEKSHFSCENVKILSSFTQLRFILHFP